MRPQDFFFIFFKFGADISLGIDKCLLAYPLLRHLVAVRIGNLEVVSEDVIETDFERRDARGLNFAVAYLCQVLLAAGGYMAQFVQGGVDAFAYDIAASGLIGTVVPNFAFDARSYIGARIDLLAYGT